MNSNNKINDLDGLFPKIRTGEKINTKNDDLVLNHSLNESVIATAERHAQEAIDANKQSAGKNGPLSLGHVENPKDQEKTIAKINAPLAYPEVTKKEEEVYVSNYYDVKKSPYALSELNQSMNLIENESAGLRDKPLAGANVFVIDRETNNSKNTKRIIKAKTIIDEFDELQAVLQTERIARMSTAHAFEDERASDPMFRDLRENIYDETFRMLNVSTQKKIDTNEKNQDVILTKIVQEPERRYSFDPSMVSYNISPQVTPTTETKSNVVNDKTIIDTPVTSQTPTQVKSNGSIDLSNQNNVNANSANKPAVDTKTQVSSNTNTNSENSNYSVHSKDAEFTSELDGTHHYREDANAFNAANASDNNEGSDINDIPTGVKVNAGHVSLDDLLKELTNELKGTNAKPVHTASTVSIKNQNLQPTNSGENVTVKQSANYNPMDLGSRPSNSTAKNSETEAQHVENNSKLNQNSEFSAFEKPKTTPIGNFGQTGQFNTSNTPVKPINLFREAPEQHEPLSANNGPNLNAKFSTISAPRAPEVDESNTPVSLNNIRSNNNPGAFMDNYLPKTESVQNSTYANKPKVDLSSAVKKPTVSFRPSSQNTQSIPTTNISKNPNPFDQK